jgi:hypothetical protein
LQWPSPDARSNTSYITGKVKGLLKHPNNGPIRDRRGKIEMAQYGFIIAALKSAPKLVKLQSFTVKCCKMWEKKQPYVVTCEKNYSSIFPTLCIA